MRHDFEQRILRNPARGAILDWQFCSTFEEYSPGGIGPTLPEIMVASTMLLHRPTIDTIKNMQFAKGAGLARAIGNNPEIVANLQDRLQTTFTYALESLAVAMAADLLVAREEKLTFPRYQRTRNTLPPRLEQSTSGIAESLAASKRLGAWFGAEKFVVTCAHLRLRF